LSDGLAFSEFRGYEGWQPVAPSVTDDRIKITGGNDAMIAAYKAGIPANGQKVPDGAVLRYSGTPEKRPVLLSSLYPRRVLVWLGSAQISNSSGMLGEPSLSW
jgi:hypothetical protein